MFLSPGVTPWKTSLPGVVDGANNPGIRVFEYDTQTLLVKVSQGHRQAIYVYNLDSNISDFEPFTPATHSLFVLLTFID